MKNTINFGVIKDGTFRKIIDDDGNIIVIVTFTDHQAIKFEAGEIEFVEDDDYFMSYFMDYDYDFIEADEAKSLLSELNYLESETYVTKDGIAVYEKDGDSHSHRPELNKEVISMITIRDRPFIRETIDLGRVIGFDHLVETTPNDEIVMFDRGRGYESRMVLNRRPEKTSKVTCIIAKAGAEDGAEWNGKYILITLFEGDPGMPEPTGRNKDNPECIAFWKNHALVPTESEKKMIV